MKNKYFYNLVVFFLIFGSCFLYFKEHLVKIFYPNEYYLSCTDFGQYLIETKDYLQDDKNYSDIIKVTEDPGFFIIASNLVRIANIPSQNILTLLSMFMYCFIGLCLLVLSLQGFSKKKYFTGIICIFLYVSLYPIVESFISGIWRQVMATIFFLVFLISRNQPNHKGYFIVSVISGVMFIFTHRIFDFIGIPALIFILLRSFMQGKKSNKIGLYLPIIIFILCIPYFAMFYEYALHVIEYKNGLRIAGPAMRGDFVLYKGFKNLGWSFFGPRDGRTAIGHFLLYQGYIFIAFIAFSRNTIKRISSVYLFVLLFLIGYISDRFDFSVRVLLTFEILLLPVIIKNFNFNYSKFLKILVVLSIFLLGFLNLSEGVITRKPVRKFDEGIYFLLNKVDKNEKHYFLSSTCGADLLGQLGFTNFFSFQMQLIGVREKKANNIPDAYELLGLTKQSITFLKREGLMFDFFKDKGKIFIILIKSDTNEVDLIKNGKSGLLGKDYIHLIYPGSYLNPGSGTIKYIFEVDTSKLLYTDTKEYIQTNIDSFNLSLDL